MRDYERNWIIAKIGAVMQVGVVVVIVYITLHVVIKSGKRKKYVTEVELTIQINTN